MYSHDSPAAERYLAAGRQRHPPRQRRCRRCEHASSADLLRPVLMNAVFGQARRCRLVLYFHRTPDAIRVLQPCRPPARSRLCRSAYLAIRHILGPCEGSHGSMAGAHCWGEEGKRGRVPGRGWYRGNQARRGYNVDACCFPSGTGTDVEEPLAEEGCEWSHRFASPSSLEGTDVVGLLQSVVATATPWWSLHPLLPAPQSRPVRSVHPCHRCVLKCH